jgi:MFS family permease
MLTMRWREALVAIAAIFIVSRGALILIALFLENNIPLAYHGPTYASGLLLSSFTGTDSIYLLGIAADGYHDAPIHEAFRDWAFFPLYPLVTRLVSVLTLGNVAVAGLLVSNAAFIAALAVLYALTIRHLDHDRAVRSLAFMAFAPGAVAFAMAYTDSLFLLLAAGAFLAGEQRRWWLMALLYGLATLTRLQGIVLGIPLAILIAESSGGWRTAAGWRTPRLLWLAAGPIAFGLFAAYLGWAFGDPLGMFTAQQAWSNIGRPETGNTTPILSRFDPIVLLLVAVLSFYVFLLGFLRFDRLKPAYLALGLMMFGATFVSMFVNATLLQSIARYMAVVWPFAWVLANRRGSTFQLVGLPASAALFAVYAMLNFTQALAP